MKRLKIKRRPRRRKKKKKVETNLKKRQRTRKTAAMRNPRSLIKKMIPKSLKKRYHY